MSEQPQDPARRTCGEGALADALRDRLRESEALDYVTASRLAAARKRALATASPPSWSWWFAGGGGLATAALVALLMFWAPTPQAPNEPVEISSADAFDLMTDEEDADFYEDLDLYRWLSEAPAGEHDADA